MLKVCARRKIWEAMKITDHNVHFPQFRKLKQCRVQLLYKVNEIYQKIHTERQLASRCSRTPVKVGHLGLIQTLLGIPCPFLDSSLEMKRPNVPPSCFSPYVFCQILFDLWSALSGPSTWVNSTSVWTWRECLPGYKVTFSLFICLSIFL